MKRLSISLIFVVISAVIGLGWGVDQWYNAKSAPQENLTIKNYKQLGESLIHLIAIAGVNDIALTSWAAQSHTKIQLTPYVDFALPSDFKALFESGEPLVLESDSYISLHYFFAPKQLVISINIPSVSPKNSNSKLRWLLTFVFYSGVILIILVWLYPLLKHLHLLRHTARAFGSGDLSARIPIGSVSYISDIELEFNNMAQRIESLVYDNKLLSRGLSHDLRTPIARLRFGLDVLEEAELSPAQQKTLVHLNRDLVAMESLVETLLSYARMEQAKISFTPQAIDLRKLVSDIVNNFYGEPLQVELQTPSSPAMIFADAEYLNMLVHNVLQNADRHGKGKIIVSVFATEKIVTLSVEDNGTGIPESEYQHVLKPFYRIAGAQNTQGHGMGLAIVDRIAQWHKATLKLDKSENLGGLKISIAFPV